MASIESRYGDIFNENDVVEYVESAKPTNTKRHEDWVVKLWSDWAEHRLKNNAAESIGLPTKLELVVNCEHIINWVIKFILEIKNNEGKDYTPTSIKCIAAALYRYLKARGYKGVSFLSRHSPVCSVIDAKLKKLKASGIGLQVKRADCVQISDEAKLWDENVLNMSTSHGLLNAVFFYNGKVLALRGRSEHKDLQIEQFQLKNDGDGKNYVEFWPLVRKTAQGSVKHSKIRSEAIKQFDTTNNNSYYKLIKLYLSKLPVQSGPFYRRPITGKSEPRYSIQLVGINTIGTMLKKMFNEAGIVDDRVISNHGLRATAATTLFEAGFSQRTISVRTGHISSAVNNYIRDSKNTHIAISNCLEPVNVEANPSDNFDECEADEIEHNNTDKVEQNEIIKSLDIVEDNVDLEISNQNMKKKLNEENVFKYEDVQSNEANERPIILEFTRGTKRLKISM
uniref:ZMYM2-like/QRICH1 C-terminal domain-containing protein n=1 Tax=Tetranychus urticae TaxID=32264 RepID=T1KN90_TETUR